MKNTIMIVGLPILALAGCATQDYPDSYNQMSSELSSLEQDQNVNEYAPVELQTSKEQLEAASTAWEDGDKEQFNHEAYLAQQQIELTKQKAELGDVQAQLEEADSRRADLMISLREREAETAEAQLAQLQEQVENGKAEQTDRGLVLTLQDLLFAFDKAQLEPGGERTVDRLAQFLKEHPNTHITVEGYTDSQGDEEYNLELSQKRAEAVVAELEKLDIARERISAQGYGEKFPIASNQEPAGRQQNRRVEVVFSSADQGYKPPE